MTLTQIEIEEELLRIGVDPTTVGKKRGARVTQAVSGLYELGVDGLGILWVGTGAAIHDRLKCLPGGRGAHDGVAWFWGGVFPETMEPELKVRLCKITGALREDDAQLAIEHLADMWRTMHVAPVVEVNEHGQVLAFAESVFICRGDAAGCSAATWLAVVDYLESLR